MDIPIFCTAPDRAALAALPITPTEVYPTIAEAMLHLRDAPRRSVLLFPYRDDQQDVLRRLAPTPTVLIGYAPTRPTFPLVLGFYTLGGDFLIIGDTPGAVTLTLARIIMSRPPYRHHEMSHHDAAA